MDRDEAPASCSKCFTVLPGKYEVKMFLICGGLDRQTDKQVNYHRID